MKLNQIIKSLLEQDMYKFSMGQAIYHQFSDYKTTWTFHCRNKDVRFTSEMVEEIRSQIRAYCSLRFTEDELAYLNHITWIKGSYVDFLRLWQPRFEDFEITDAGDCGLSVETKGTWLNTSMYEYTSGWHMTTTVFLKASVNVWMQKYMRSSRNYSLVHSVSLE